MLSYKTLPHKPTVFPIITHKKFTCICIARIAYCIETIYRRLKSPLAKKPSSVEKEDQFRLVATWFGQNGGNVKLVKACSCVYACVCKLRQGRGQGMECRCKLTVKTDYVFHSSLGPSGNAYSRAQMFTHFCRILRESERVNGNERQ